SGPSSARRSGRNSCIFFQCAKRISTRLALDETSKISVQSPWDRPPADMPPVENRELKRSIKYQMAANPITTATAMTMKALSAILVQHHGSNGKIVELEIRFDASQQYPVAAEELERIGHHSPIDQALVQVGDQRRTHDEFEREEHETSRRHIEALSGGRDINDGNDRIGVQNRQHRQERRRDADCNAQSRPDSDHQSERDDRVSIDRALAQAYVAHSQQLRLT